jgi:hypothetical protein
LSAGEIYEKGRRKIPVSGKIHRNKKAVLGKEVQTDGVIRLLLYQCISADKNKVNVSRPGKNP